MSDMKTNSSFMFAEITEIYLPYETYESKMWINAKFLNATASGKHC